MGSAEHQPRSTCKKDSSDWSRFGYNKYMYDKSQYAKQLHKQFYQLPLILIVNAAHCLINMVFLMSCAFIRSWWRCTFWMTSLMTLNQHKNRKYVTIASLKSETIGKLINRIPGLRLLNSSLPGSTLRTHVESLSKPCNVNMPSQSLAW